MSWLDPLIVLAVLFSMGVGWTRGSVWYSSGLAAGFLGLWAADIYGPVASTALGRWPGAGAAGTVLVFVAVALAVVVAGWVLRKILSTAFLGFMDKLSGFIVGGAFGAALTLVVLTVVLTVKPAWKTRPVFKDSFFMSRIQAHSLSLSLPGWARMRRSQRSLSDYIPDKSPF